MSYAYLFKYIIIGDTGKSLYAAANERNSLIHPLFVVSRRRKIMLVTPVYGQEIPIAARSDNWCRVRRAHYPDHLEEY